MPKWVVCASGPSLHPDDIALAKQAGCKMAVVNNSWELCPDADLLYAADAHWWEQIPSGKKALQQFKGLKFCASNSFCKKHPEVTAVQVNTREVGWNTAEDWVYGGRLSGYQILQVVGRYEPDVIILLGYDHKYGAGGITHWHGDHPRGFANSPNLHKQNRGFKVLAAQAKAAGVTIINATRDTALECFERMTLEEALKW